jgi:hypothetical protein
VWAPAERKLVKLFGDATERRDNDTRDDRRIVADQSQTGGPVKGDNGLAGTG